MSLKVSLQNQPSHSNGLVLKNRIQNQFYKYLYHIIECGANSSNIVFELLSNMLKYEIVYLTILK